MKSSLNSIFRTIWSEALGAWVAVSEITKTKGKRSSSSLIRSIRPVGAELDAANAIGGRLKPIVFAVACCFALNAQANPIGGQVVNGQATFNNTGNTLTVTNTPGTIINWQGFSINSNEVTHFAQQSAASAVLNRVITNNPSAILGTLSSNGQVFLVNPAGIFFGSSSTVDVAGLVATSLNLSDADFLAGRHHYSAVEGAQNISNAGNITARQNGQIYLIAPNVENTGIINAPNGEILLVAGHSVELVNDLDPNLRVNITAPAGDTTNIGQLVASAGRLGLFGTMVKNAGAVSADSATLQGGKIVFKSSQRTEITGTASAQGVGGGEIKVLSDMSTGTVQLSGTLDASAPTMGDGGFIDTSAAHVNVADTARVSTLAANGNHGTWLIDPPDFTIAATGGDMTGAAVAAALAGGNVIIQSSAGTVNVAGLGDIHVNDAITKNDAAATTLTMQAANNIAINANISSTNITPTALNLVLNHGAAGSATLNATLALAGGNVDIQSAGVTGTGILNVTAGTTALTGALTASTLNISNGTLNLNNVGASSFSNMSMTGGILGGVSNIVLGAGSTFNWIGGTINGHLTTQGTTTVPTGSTTLGTSAVWDNSGTVTIISGGWGYIGSGATINNSGTFDIGGSFGMQFTGTGGQFNNLVGGTVILSGIYGLPFYNGGVNGTFNNAGTLNKTSTSSQSFHVVNTGTINVTTGTLELTGTWSNVAGTINLSGGTLGLGGSFTTATLPLGTLSRTGGTVNLTGNLDNTGNTLDVSAGLFGTGGLGNLSGTITGGTITGAALTSSSGTLNNVIIGSSMTESGTLTITNDLLLGNGVNFDTGASTLYFSGLAANIGLAAGATSATLTKAGGALYANTVANNGVVTIGSGVTVQGYGSLPVYYGGGGWVNNGTIISNTVGQTFTISSTNFTNAATGVVRATAGTTTISSATLTSNAGSLLDVNGGTLTVSPTAWNGASNLNLTAGILNMDTAFSAASLGTYTRTGGTFNIGPSGNLDNTGNTLDISAGLFGTGGLGNLSGTITGGTITGAALTSSSGTLNNVIIGSSMTESGTLTITNDLLLGNGVNFDTGASTLYFSGLAANIGLAAGATSATLTKAGGALYANTVANNGVVTIGSGVTVQGYGSLPVYYGGGGWVNNGTIISNTVGQTFTISSTNFTNAATGVVRATAGTTTISSATLTSNAGSLLDVNGGTLTVSPTAWNGASNLNLTAGILNMDTAFSAASLGTYTRTGGTFNIGPSGNLDNTGNTLDISAGLFGTGGLGNLSGTITGGTITGAALTSSSGTLNNVIIGSSMTESGTLTITNDLLLGNGVNFDTGASTLYFSGLAANIGLAAGATSATLTKAGGALYANTVANNGVVTIGSGVTVQGYGSLPVYYGGGGWVNNGTIISNTVGQTFTISSTNFTNAATGVVRATAGTTTISSATLTSNAGSLLDVNGGTLTVSPTAWNGASNLNLTAGILNMDTAFSAASLGTYTRTGGTFNIGASGNLDNTGSTLDLGGGLFGTGGLGTLSGTITGGTITGTTLTSSSGKLNNVIIGSSMTESGTLTITNDLVLGNGVNFDTGASTLYFSGLAANIGLAAGATSATLTKAGGALYANTVANNGVVTIGSGVTVQGYGSLPVYYGGGGWVNNGTIISNTVGQTFTISSTNFTNAATGVVRATAGTTTISSATFTSNAGSLLDVNGGTLTVSPTAWNGASNLNLTAGILNMDTAFSAASLGTYTRTGGTFNIGASGNLDNTGSTLDLGGGLFGTGGLGTLSGTITGGTITGTTLTSSSGKLNNVIIGSSMTESGTLTITNDLVLGNGVNFDTGASTLYFSGLAANIGLAAGATSATLTKAGGALYANTVANNGVVTIGSGVTVQGYGSLPVYYGGGGWVNNGTIISNTVGQTFTISSTNFTNAATGVVRATAGTTTISSATFTSNAGSLLDVNGGTLTVSPTAWNGASNLNLTAGILNMDTAFSAASLGTYTRTGGTFNIGASGNLDNTGSTLDLGGGLFGTGGLGTLSGTITGGTITGTTLTSSSGKLNNVIIGSSMTESGTLTITNDLVLGNGVNFDTGASTLYFSGLAANIGLAAGATSATLTKAGGALYANTVANNGVVTIGSGVTVQGYGSLPVYYGGGGWVNNGTIISNTAGQTLTIGTTNFTNNNVMSATAGTLSINSANFTNSLGSSITAGTGTNLNISGTTFNNNGTISFSGGTATINPTTTLANAGTITLGGTTHTIGSGATTNWTNTGNIAFNTGTLNLNGNYTIAGLTSNLDPALHFTRGAGTTFNFGGTLDLAATTLDMGSAGLFGTGGLGILSGTLLNGTITGTTLTSSSGTLNNVTIGSSMTESGTLTITNDLVLGNGVNFDTGASTLYFSGLAANIGLAAGATSATLTKAGGALYANTVANNGVVTIGSGVTVQGYGSLPVYYGGGGWVNNGTIISNTVGQTFTISSTNFTNNNVMSATAGTLNVSTTTFTTSATSDILIGNGATLTRVAGFTNAGTLRGDGTLNLGTSTLTNSGAINPGSGGAGSFGMLRITGNLDNTAGTLNMEIGGLVPSVQHDRVYVSGTFTQGGTLNVSNAAYTPGGTDSFNLFQAGTLAGTFTTANAGTYNLLSNTGTVYVSTNGAALPSTINAWWLDGSGTWGTLANWTNQAVPVATDDVVLDRTSGAYTITNNAVTATIASLLSSENLLFSGGSLTVNGSTTLNGNTEVTYGVLNMNGGAINNGILSGINQVTVSTLTNNGIIAPGSATIGDPTNTFTITGNLVMGAGGAINLDLDNTVAGNYDILNVSGTANLTGGTLNLSGLGALGNYPSINVTGGVTGTFATVNVGGLNAAPSYGPNAVSIAITLAGLSWDGGAGTNLWIDALNWSTDTLPTSADEVTIGAVAGGIIISSGAQSANSLVCDANLTISGGSLTLVVPSTINATLTIAGGTLNAPTSLVVNDYQQTAGALNAPAVFALTSLSGINVAGGTLSSASSIVAMTAANNITVSVPFSANSFILGGGTWNQISATLPSFNVSNFSIAGGTFIRALGGNGSALTPYQLTDIFGVQGIGSAGMLGNSYVLANNINASGTVNWNAGAGFAPIGISATPFTGTFDGMLKTVNNLAITRPSLVQTGLFGITATGSSISNVGLVGGVVSGNYYVGGLVGYNGGNVSNSYTSAGVSGALYYVGGLVGWNNGTVNNSHATGIVAAGDQSVGGLVGYNFGSVSNSYATGNTTGSFVVGGLVGNSVGTVTNSFATGNVQGVQYAIGGLVGQNGGGTISNSFATGASLSTASGQVGGLVGYNSGTINTSYATGSVTGLSQVGGLVGYNDNYGIPGIINNSYWDVQTTLQAQGADVGIAVSNGLTTAQMKSLSSFTGWNIANTGGAGMVWRIYEGQAAPLLGNFLTPLTVSASGSRAFNASTDVSALVTYSQTPNANLLGTAVANTSSANAGTYAVTPSGLYSNQTGYDITFTSGIVNITPAGLTLLSLSANDASKMYGDAFTFTGTEFTPVGLIGSDTISGISLTSTGAVATANVGNYAIVPSNAVFGTGSASNYNITYANGTLTVTQRPVTITAQAASMVYGSADPTLFSVGGPYGLAAGDSIITAFSGRFDHAGGNNVGIHAITQGSFTSSNYSISSFTPNTLTITPATLTVYADDLNKILGTSDPLLTYRVGGLKYFDTAANTLSGGLVRDTGETIGSYGIEQGSLAVSNSNYQLSFAYVPGTFSILAPTVVQEITQATVGPVKAEETTKVEEDEEKKKTEQLAQDEVTTGEDTAQLPKQLPVCQ